MKLVTINTSTSVSKLDVHDESFSIAILLEIRLTCDPESTITARHVCNKPVVPYNELNGAKREQNERLLLN